MSILGWLAMLCGGAWAVLAVMFMGLDAPESTLALLIAMPGALLALLGLGLVVLANALGASRRSR
ncbi:hypothetical protein [Azospirillum largimobile]